MPCTHNGLNFFYLTRALGRTGFRATSVIRSPIGNKGAAPSGNIRSHSSARQTGLGNKAVGSYRLMACLASP